MIRVLRHFNNRSKRVALSVNLVRYLSDPPFTHIRLVHLEGLGDERFERDDFRAFFQVEEKVCEVRVERRGEYLVIHQLASQLFVTLGDVDRAPTV